MAGIYIHIPFCKQKCSYCNFHFSTNLRGKSDIQKALIQEIGMRSMEIAAQPIETIYLGGGTPSLWTIDELNQLFSAIYRLSNEDLIQEITLECNPDDLTPEYLNDLKRHTPVNRISVGIQSFHEDDLRLMNRSHNATESVMALEYLFNAGFTSVSADLIFGLPHSDSGKWYHNLTTITQYPINHISCYSLTIEEKTAFGHQLQQGKLALPDDKVTVKQFYMAQNHFKERGFLHYEISNYGLPGHLALHNTNYWKNIPYIGIGPSAHSYDGFRRRWNVADNLQYVRKVATGDVFWQDEILEEKDLYNEYIMTGLRTMWGVSDARIQEFSGTIRKEFYDNLKLEQSKGNVVVRDSTYHLTQQAQAIADQIIYRFFCV